VILRRKGEGSDQYFKHLFKSHRFIQQLTRNIEGLRDGKMISYKQFSEQLIPTPAPVEQQKIADCLTSLDEVIAAQGQKVEALKTYKRGLMQQLFPREGETLPRLRFPEFRDAEGWSVKPIGDLICLEYGASLPEHVRRVGAIPVIGSNGIVGYHNEALIKGPAIIIGRKGSVGQITWIKSGCFPIDTTFYVGNKEPSKNLMQFLYRVLQISKLEQRRDSGAVPGLNRNEVHSLKIAIPDGSEQQKIADCLTSLDIQIAAESEKFNALKTHKKGLMQQLFPSPEVD
jgi:type I restriction enzyme S subunit